MVIQMRYRANTGLIYGRLRRTWMVRGVELVNDKEKQDIRDIVHSLNNVLTGVLGNISLAGMYLGNEEVGWLI